MKNYILFFLFLILSINTDSQIYLGGNLGLNIAKVHFDSDDLNNSFKYIGRPKFGYNAGVVANFYFSRVLNLKTDLQYSQKGFKYEQTYVNGFKTFNYAFLSACGQLDVNPYDDIIFSPYLGAYFAFWISGIRQESNIKTNTTQRDIIYLKSDSSFAYNRYDSGIVPGFELKFKQKNKRWLILGLKYDFGMISTDVDKVAGWKNRNLTIYLHYVFRIKR